MSTGRLTFLYPPLLRVAVRGGASQPPFGGATVTGLVKQKSSFARRHGKAVEPQPLQKPTETPEPPVNINESQAERVEKVAAAAAAAAAEPKTEMEQAALPVTNSTSTTTPTTPTNQSNTSTGKASATSTSTTTNKAVEVETSEEERARTTRDDAKQSGPLEAVLHMQAPEKVAKQHPSMSPPPYVHHFDSYSLVKQLQDAGYTQSQATTAMKGIRGALAKNLDVAQASLVSKSDVENETYLFTAACSELSTEIKNNRRLQDEQIRQQRTHLQHEVDILTQSLNQELLTLNDNVRGMFNDRKMAVREEQKTAESAVQQINYKISIMLSSDAKSEIEGVRWILIRRSVVGILFMAVLTLGTLRYATYVSHERQREAERKRREEEERRRDGGKRDHSSAPDAAVILAAN